VRFSESYSLSNDKLIAADSVDVFSLILVRASPSLAAICIHALLIIPTLFPPLWNMIMIMIQMSAFFIGVLLGTALIAQKCQALIDATKDSCVSLSPFNQANRDSFAILGILKHFILFFDLFRLEERGWLVSNANLREAGGGGGERGSVVLVKTSKKKGIMDHERYLDATQRYVHPLFTPPSFSSALPFPFPFPFPSSVFVSFFGCVHSYS